MPATIPIIGQPKILQHYHTYILQCPCAEKTVSVMIGEGVGAPCPGCQSSPVLRVGDRGQLQLALVPYQPAGSV